MFIDSDMPIQEFTRKDSHEKIHMQYFFYMQSFHEPIKRRRSSLNQPPIESVIVLNRQYELREWHGILELEVVLVFTEE